MGVLTPRCCETVPFASVVPSTVLPQLVACVDVDVEILRILVPAEANEDAGGALCPLDVACHQLDGCEQGTNVETAWVWLDQPFVPHVQSPAHPESAACDAIAARYMAQGQQHWALTDGQVMLVDGDKVTIL